MSKYPRRNDFDDDDNHHEEEEEDEENPAFQAVDEFCENVAMSCAEFSETMGKEVYAKRLRAIIALSSITNDLEAILKALRDLTNSVGILPNATMEGVMKGFARTRSFKHLSEHVAGIAEGIMEQEDVWNDMAPLEKEVVEKGEAHPLAPVNRPASRQEAHPAEDTGTHPMSASKRRR